MLVTKDAEQQVITEVINEVFGMAGLQPLLDDPSVETINAIAVRDAGEVAALEEGNNDDVRPVDQPLTGGQVASAAHRLIIN